MPTEILVAIIAGVVAIVTTLLNVYIGNRQRDSRVRNYAEKYPKLTIHPIFDVLDSMRNYSKISTYIQDIGRRTLYEDIIELVYKTWTANLKETTKCVDEKVGMSEVELSTILNGAINQIRSQYISYRNPDLTKDEQRLFDFCMRKFYSLVTESQGEFKPLIESIVHSDYVGNTKAKAAVALDIYSSYFIRIVRRAEEMFIALNGELSGQTYRKIKIS